jgi:4-hydroxy-4-methyl-2-oxoglutarate aldolase
MKELCRRLSPLPTAVVSDVLYEMGLTNQVLSSAIKPIGSHGRVTGPALCLDGRNGPEPSVSGKASKPVFEMDRHIAPGAVAVIASGGECRIAVIGDNVALAWQLKQCAGVVTDGGIRDASNFDPIGLAAFSAFTTPVSPKGRWAFARIDQPVRLRGQIEDWVTVAPGDIVHGDADGVVIIPKAHADSVVAAAEILEGIEQKLQTELRTGEDREAVYARHPKFGHIKKVAG